MANDGVDSAKETQELKTTLDDLYKQQANEKTQFQLIIQQQKLEIDQLTQEADELRLANGMWQEQFQGWEGTRAAQETQILTLQENIKTSANELVTCLEEQEQLKNTIQQLTSQLDEANRQVESFTQQTDCLCEEKKQLLEEKTKFETHIINLQSQNESLQTQVKITGQDMNAASTNANAKAKKLEEMNSEKQEQIEALQKKVKNLQDQLDFLATSGVGPAGACDAIVNTVGSNVTAVLMDLRAELLSKSRELVEQAEKNVVLANKFDQTKETVMKLKKDVSSAREFLLKGIMHTDEVDVSNYQHIALEELVRLRLKAFEHEVSALNGGSAQGNDETVADGDDDSTYLNNVDKFSVDELGAVGKIEKELRSLRSRNKRLHSRCENLEKELQKASSELSELNNLKQKALDFALREKSEKELRIQNENEKKQNADKIQQLSTHIEKLMVHLKHEAASKTKASDEKKRLEKELAELKAKNATLGKNNSNKDKEIEEISQGSKILQDQLRLMDEKFIEVRNKLDYTRSTSQKEMKRLHNELNTLRMKWQMASDAGLLNGMPDYSLMAKYSKRSKPLGCIASETQPRVEKSPSEPTQAVGNQASSSACKVRFEIPKLPQKDAENDMPWADEKLHALQIQLNRKQQG